MRSLTYPIERRTTSMIHETTTTTNKELDWASMVFGTFNVNDVLKATKDERWQRVRVSMLGTCLQRKFCTLNVYLQEEAFSIEAKIRVTNYVNALRRGGMIK